MSLIFLIFPITYFFDKKRVLSQHVVYFSASIIKFLNPWWKLKISGLENLLPKNVVAVYVANHQSLVDSFFVHLLKRNFCWIGKEAAFKVPLFGLMLKALNYIPVDRKSKKSGELALKLAANRLSSGVSMFFFPEGTRSWDGHLGKFKYGAFALAKNNNVPIIPISLAGCEKILPKGTLLYQNANIKLIVHPSIDSQKHSVEELAYLARTAILNTYSECENTTSHVH